MASTAAQNYITLDVLLNCSYSMIAIASGFALTRIGVRLSRPKAISVDDVLVLLSYFTFLTQTILYIYIAKTVYRVSDAVAGRTKPYPELMEDALAEIKVFFANTMLFWCTLWLVKGSLLALYRRLLKDNKFYRRIWWGVVVFCVVTFIGAIISNLTSCSSMKAWFTPGACATPRDTRAQIGSLYYAFAVDVLSDLMVMLLPIGLVWNLKMPRVKKAGIITLFAVGCLAVIAAIIRVVSIGSRAGSSTPSSTWLAFWATIEGGIAVIIGTAPGLYTTARKIHTSRKESRYGGYSQGYIRHTGDISQKQQEASKISGSQSISNMSQYGEEVAIVQPSQQHRISTSFPQALSPKQSSAVMHREVFDDIEMSSSNSWTQPHIMVTKQFTVRSEKR